jgi:hypothetical protein
LTHRWYFVFAQGKALCVENSTAAAEARTFFKRHCAVSADDPVGILSCEGESTDSTDSTDSSGDESSDTKHSSKHSKKHSSGLFGWL